MGRILFFTVLQSQCWRHANERILSDYCVYVLCNRVCVPIVITKFTMTHFVVVIPNEMKSPTTAHENKCLHRTMRIVLPERICRNVPSLSVCMFSSAFSLSVPETEPHNVAHTTNIDTASITMQVQSTSGRHRMTAANVSDDEDENDDHFSMARQSYSVTAREQI